MTVPNPPQPIALRTADIGISTAAVRQPTLDEVFLAITGHHADHTTDIEDPR